MRIDILTLFPDMFRGPFDESIIKRGAEDGLVDINFHQIRDYSHSKHGKVDDYPFGGGMGMVMQAEPIMDCLKVVKEHNPGPVILTTPRGRRFDQKLARQLAKEEGLIFICGHYEGVDERVIELAVDMEVSLGDFVLTGGELAAMVMTDAVVRLKPGVLAEGSDVEESFENGLLEYPQYTRPQVYEGLAVPPVLVSGDHEKIRRWRLKESLKRTMKDRPDLLEGRAFTKEEKRMIDEILKEGV